MGKAVACCSVAAVTCGILCLVFGIVVVCLFDPFIRSIIDQKLVLKNDENSQMYQYWANPPIVPYLKIYFFNLTNREEFMNLKQKPIFVEVGPYSYREKWTKVNISFHDNGTVTYQTKKEYFFDISKSNGTEDDIIHTLNVPVNVAVQKISRMGRLVQLAFSSLLAVLKETAFVHKSVRQLVWGYNDTLIAVAKKYLPKDQQLPFDKFGFFYQRNGSTDGLLNVYTGADGVDNYTIIDTFERAPELHFWRSHSCNSLNRSTDGTSFPPNVNRDQHLYLFNRNLCRALPLRYNASVSHYGLTALRFTPPPDVFASAAQHPENACFCAPGLPCPGGGVFNIGACNFNVTSLISWPHFFEADRKYLNAVSGLSPDPLKHRLFVDVNPELGTPMAAQARVQINFLTERAPLIKPLANMTDLVFPVLWFEDGVDVLPPSLVDLLRSAVSTPHVLKAATLSVLFVGGGALVVGGVFFLGARMRRRRSVLSITKSASAADFAAAAAANADVDGGHVNPTMSPEDPDA